MKSTIKNVITSIIFVLSFIIFLPLIIFLFKLLLAICTWNIVLITIYSLAVFMEVFAIIGLIIVNKIIIDLIDGKKFNKIISEILDYKISDFKIIKEKLKCIVSKKI